MIRKQDNLTAITEMHQRVLNMVFGDDSPVNKHPDGDYCRIHLNKYTHHILIDAHISKPAVVDNTGTHGYLKVSQRVKLPTTVKITKPTKVYERWLIRQLFTQLRHYIMSTEQALTLFPFLRQGSIRCLPADDRTVWSGSSEEMKSAPVLPIIDDTDITVPF